MHHIADRRWKLFVLLAISGQTLLELNSIDLLLWPIEHSCARPANASDLTSLLADLSTRQVALDDLQKVLVDARPEDPLTMARASSMDVDYHDIGHCYEYPLIKDINHTTGIINTAALEACQNGVHYEPLEPNLSIVGHFELSCRRQWLKTLLPQSVGLGMLIGHLSFALVTRKADCDLRWLLVQTVVGVLGLLLGDLCLESGHNYLLLVFVVLARSLIVGSLLARVSSTWRTSKIEHLEVASQLNDHLICLVAVVSLVVLFKALFLPVALTIFAHWQSMNQMSTLNVLGLLVVVTFYECYSRIKQARQVNRQSSSSAAPNSATQRGINWRQVLLSETPTRDDDLELKEELNHANSNEQQNSPNHLHPGVCEFCLSRDQNVAAQPTGLVVVVDTYRPTTMPMSSQNGQPLTTTTTTGHSLVNYINLMEFSTLAKLTLLTLCLALNCMILQMMPNHRLLHPESLESLLKRKSEYYKTHGDPNVHVKLEALVFHNQTPQLEQHLYQLTGETNANNVAQHPNLNQTLNSTNKNNSSLFNFNSVDYNSNTIGTLRDSQNILEILWTTCCLNDWLVELLIIILIYGTHFGSIYFKLNRLFSVVSLGSGLLCVQWLLVALARRQHHLFAWYWLRVVAYLLAKSVATLMYLNFLYTILRLSKLMQTTKLTNALRVFECLMVALVVGSLAPMAERWSLIIIPLVLALNNLLVYYLAKQVSRQFKENLCPMMFDDD